MRRAARFIICVIAFALIVFSACAAGFVQNSDEIEEAAKSVLKLFVYDSKYADVEDYFSTGSGFVAFNSSTLVTNYHVIEGAEWVLALDDKDNSYELKYVLCADQEFDIAILEFEKTTSLKPLELFPDDELKRGAPVVAIGSPKGLKNTVSTGIVSSVFKEDEIPYIQITAPISPGSSGGALFNDNGKVIGVTTSAYKTKDETGEDTAAQNINFAVNSAVPQAMYKAWDGNKYAFGKQKKTAKMDFTGVYEHSSQSDEKNSRNEINETETASVNNEQITASWTCLNCGTVNENRFCQECGAEKPGWVCVCGKENNGKFCGSCGRKAEDLVLEFNVAIDHIKTNEFAKAIEELEALGKYDSGSFSTIKGTHSVAKECIPEAYYEQGMYLVSVHGDHDTILECFKKAGEYKDAKDQIKIENDRYYGAFYKEGIEKMEAGEFEAAIKELEKAGDYADAKAKIQYIYYSYGTILLSNKEFEKSRSAFEKAGVYSDASTMIQKTYYEEGLECYNLGQYYDAIDLFSKAGNYSNTKLSIQMCNYALGKEAMQNGLTEEAVRFFIQAEGYEDANDLIEIINEDEKAKAYANAQELFDAGQFSEAKAAFLKLSGYKDADMMIRMASVKLIEEKYEKLKITTLRDQIRPLVKELDAYMDLTAAQELYKKMEYRMGVLSVKAEAYLDAIGFFENADDYEDASVKLAETKEEYFNQLIKKKEYEKAGIFYLSKMKPFGQTEEKILMQSGDTGEIPKYIFEVIRVMELSRNIPKDEDTYKEDYIAGVQKFEEHFGLVADGKITLDEYIKVKDLIYKGCKSVKVRKLNEKLFDLSYLRNLASDHTVYANNYFNGIKAAEKDLGLKVDGVVTAEEYETILKQKVDIKNPENIKIQVNKDTVTLTWTKVPGAINYKVYDGTKLLDNTKECRFVIKNVETGVTKYYKIEAIKYTVTSSASIAKYIEPYYKPISAADLNKEKWSLIGKFVSMGNLRIKNWSIYLGDEFKKTESAKNQAQVNDGHDVYLLCSTGNSYVEIILEDYKGWGWDNQTQDFLGMIDRITTISIRGTVKNCSASWGGINYIPSIVINQIQWNYY